MNSIFAGSQKPSIELTGQNAGKFYQACEALNDRLSLSLREKPKIYLEQGASGARVYYSKMKNGEIENARVVLTTGLVAKCNCKELLGVVAHELGHIKYNQSPATFLGKILSYSRFVNVPYEFYQSKHTIFGYLATEVARPFATLRNAATAYLHRREELEADKTAVELIGAKHWVNTLAKAQESEGNDKAEQLRWIDRIRITLYASHPSDTQRKSHAERLQPKPNGKQI